ncbi:class I SAM-dependent methyltransferase [Aureimonas fodinaquatilis]|uniref:Class I SAM-dependent methyltransferase n=1 Tax=Aureimonas fodinaquatilis TaxID=2565783 RepID=A0A5B0E2X5_9HYPH|nr:SAM-dependent methyltransferase [Aureimonas fodinaquatilis]KAA0971779.1 class I SAM-dependent methyltransferase [Aureimonas fodinaquatilis]
MSDLTDRISRAIAENGPLTLEQFWNIALFDPQAGYYTTGQPFGAQGDFTTSPEISQMFGELIGAWLVAAWRHIGRPASFALVEIGPGRGTLMADILRTVRQLDIAFLKAASIRLIEVSDALASAQLARLEAYDLPIVRHRNLAEVPEIPMLLVANELFDAIAIRQFRHDGANWCEQLVTTGESGFEWQLGPPVSGLPLAPHMPAPRLDDIFEASAPREALARAIGARIQAHGGAALMIDYGHERSGFGDTLQALHRHQPANPLAQPGYQDITSHVDFERLAIALAASGAKVSSIVPQGQFLLSLGLAQRADVLNRQADAQRLAGNGVGEMGELFKVLAVASQRLPLPPFD